MNSDKIKTLIIEDNRMLANDIAKALPEYFEVVISKYSEGRNKVLEDEAGSLPGVVIMNADDERSLGIYKFMKSDENGRKARNVPVLLLTKDEFSDNCMDFLSEGEPEFYTGDVTDDLFYLAVSDAIDNAEIYEDNIEENIEDTVEKELSDKSVAPEKIMGKSFNIHVDENVPMRVAAFADEKVLKAMEGIVDRNRKKAVQVREVLKEVEEEKQKQKEIKLKESTPKENTKVDNGNTSRQFQNPQNVNIQMQRKVVTPNIYRNMQPGRVANLLSEQDQQQASKEIKRIVVVDYDTTTQKACELFLNKNIKTIFVDSNMKAIDYFVKDTADVVMIEYEMPGISGLSILKSIRMQMNGRNTKAIILMSDKKSDATREKALNTPGVVGIVNKPIVKKQLLSVINKCK